MHTDGFGGKVPKWIRGRFLRICVIAAVLFFAVYSVSMSRGMYWYSRRLLETQDQLYESTVRWFQSVPNGSNGRKLVLLWTDYFNEHNYLPTTNALGCRETRCDASADRSLLKKSSAVVLHWRNVNMRDLPPDCSPKETCPLWVLFNKEAPPHTPKYILQDIQSKIHWVATYRRDSDVYAPYGIVRYHQNDYQKPDFDPSRRLVCWLVSNCRTPGGRETYVHELASYVEVDVYGKCGSLTCPHKSAKDCYLYLSKKCKFYLSLENSSCRDYTTEKLYYALMTDMVPVVMGNCTNYNHLPPRSYINAAEFSSPKALAHFLLKVGSDRSLYESYFEWKKYYSVVDGAYRWFCELCEKLHSRHGVSVKTNRNLVTWWYNLSGCH